MSHPDQRAVEPEQDTEQAGHADSILTRLAAVFEYAQAALLTSEEDGLCCAEAVPSRLAALDWISADFLLEVANGRIVATCTGHDWPDGVPAGQPALCFPLYRANRPSVVVLLREAEARPFSQRDLSLAREFALASFATGAARAATDMGARLRELRFAADQSLDAKGKVQAESDIAGRILDLLPVGVKVEDEAGNLVLINAAAAALGQANGDTDRGAKSLPSSQHDVGQKSDASADSVLDEVEEKITGPNGERILLTRCRPVRVLDRSLLLSTSVDITTRKQIEDELLRRAFSDELTGLANAAMTQEHVESIIAGGRSEHFALALVDLDNFKHVNDYYSPAVADTLLVKVAQRIGTAMRASDMLTRMSGHQFALLIEPVESEAQLRATIDIVLQKLKQPFHLDGFEVFTSASIGVSLYPQHGRRYEQLRRNAENALHRSRQDTKGAATFYDLNIGKAVALRMETEQRLRLAIRDRKFCCAFQPKVDIRSRDVIGFETLVRWRDENSEIQPPASFIDLATELGLINPITQYVLVEAIRSVDQLDAAFGSNTKIAVNVAARQAGDIDFMRSFIDTLKESQRADRFIVEVTEDAFLAKSRFQRQVLPMLREIGVGVSIDDFGTGYSSLSLLADITADEIKIDRSFITAIHQRPRSQSILKAIESVSVALGMTVIAEGVETFEELTYLLAATRIRYAQGYYFSKPFFLEDDEFLHRIDDGERPMAQSREHDGSRETTGARAAAGARGD